MKKLLVSLATLLTAVAPAAVAEPYATFPHSNYDMPYATFPHSNYDMPYATFPHNNHTTSQTDH